MKDKTPISKPRTATRVPSSLDRRLPNRKDAAGRLADANREIQRLEFRLQTTLRIRDLALKELQAEATSATAKGGA